MTREILLPATSGQFPSPSLMCWVAIDRAMRLAISVKSAKAAPRSVSSGMPVERRRPIWPFAVKWMPSSRRRTLSGCAHHRGGRRRTTQFFGIVGAPVEAVVPTTLASMRAVIEYLVEFDGHIDYLPTLLKSSILRSPACCRGKAR